MFTPTIDNNTVEFKYFSVPRGNQIVPNFGGEKKIKKGQQRPDCKMFKAPCSFLWQMNQTSFFQCRDAL